MVITFWLAVLLQGTGGTLLPPALLQPVPAPYTREAVAAGVEGRVLLQLSIDATGAVTDAVVSEGLGFGLDESARAAALQLEFQPATQDGEAIAAQVMFAVEFVLPLRAVTGAVQPPNAAVTLTAVDGGLPRSTATDASGHFRFDEVAAGEWRLDAVADGYAPFAQSVMVGLTADVELNVVMTLPPPVEKPAMTMVVRGQSESQRRAQSSESVTVVPLDEAKRESADLGEVLSRTQGVSVRRSSGLGSVARFSINGFTDDQVRFFLDGIPLEYAGYPFGIANVPVNLIERIDLYSGVGPVRFGADALGGAVDLVTESAVQGHRVSASYELGSFGTHRVAATGRYQHEPSGFFVRANAFLDVARNDYPVDVQVTDERGRLSDVTVPRFHDAYRAVGASVEAGVVDRSWAERLLVKAFVSDFDKQYQHNISMSVPYGSVNYAEGAVGASAHYQHHLRENVAVNLVAGYTTTRGNYLDTGTCVVDWYGRCVRTRDVPGETTTRPLDQLFFSHTGFARLVGSWQVAKGHEVRLALAPTGYTRTGDDLLPVNPDARDPLSAERRLFSMVNGVEYQADFFDERVQNTVFVKQYFQQLWSEEPRPGDYFRRLDRSALRFGGGDGLRVRLAQPFWLKASYEYATRLPRPDEVFGDNAFTVPNLELVPETSHNLNLGAQLDWRRTVTGSWRGAVNGFCRGAQDLIVQLGNEQVKSSQNVFGARSVGAEGALGWSAPRDVVSLDVNATWLELRNVAERGTFGDYAGDRIPNRPFVYGNLAVRLQWPQPLIGQDQLWLSWTTRYVHPFFRSWESLGLPEFKQTIPAQWVHGASIAYLIRGEGRAFSFSAEVQNLGDQRVYDFFGVQRPGRAFYAKTTVDF